LQKGQLGVTTTTPTLPIQFTKPKLSLQLFQPAMAHMEAEFFENSGLLDRFIGSLNDAATNSVSSNDTASSSSFTVPPQLALYDAFTVMELNVRICRESLRYKEQNLGTAQVSSATSSGVAGAPHKNQRRNRITPLDMCRLFLSQTGILPNERIGNANGSVEFKQVKLLESNAKLERSLKHLDKSPSRETMKIGVVYAGPYQTTQQEILKNTSGSLEYEEFLAELGWQV